MARTISASVGINGVNRPADVRNIQQLLNQVQAPNGGPTPPLIVDEKCGPLTKKAIQNFQLRNFGWSIADGRIDPNGPTLAKLNEYEQASLPPPEPAVTEFSIQRLGFTDTFSGHPNERFFRVWDFWNVRVAVYWLRRQGEGYQSSTPSQLLATPLAPRSRFRTAQPHRLACLNFACEYFSRSDAAGKVTSEFTIYTHPAKTVIPMQHHLNIVGPNLASNLVGEFTFVEFLIPY